MVKKANAQRLFLIESEASETLDILETPEASETVETPETNILAIKQGILADLALVNRLTFSSGLNQIIKKAINSIAGTFQVKVARLLSPIRPGKKEPSKEEFLENSKLKNLTIADLDELEAISGTNHILYARKEIREMIEAVLSDCRYKIAIEHYIDQAHSSNSREELNHFLSHHGFQEEEDIPTGMPLYHGIALGKFGNEYANADEQRQKELLSVENYSAKIVNIRKKGLLASEAPENLPQLESIFCVSAIQNAHGIAAIRFPMPAEDKLWVRISSHDHEALQMVKKELTGPSQLLLRSPAFYDVLEELPPKNIFSQLDRQEYISFLNHLKNHLRDANINFRMIDPDSTTYQAE